MTSSEFEKQGPLLSKAVEDVKKKVNALFPRKAMVKEDIQFLVEIEECFLLDYPGIHIKKCMKGSL